MTNARWVATTLAPRARIVLVHAIEPPATPSFLFAETLPAVALQIDAIARAKDQLREVAREIGGNASDIEVRVGIAYEVAMEVAADVNADLIAVGPHGNREHESVLLGTTADSLVRAASVPVLIGARAPLRGIAVVAAVTESPATSSVLALANSMAQRLNGGLTVLHAIEPAAYSHMASLAAAHARGDASIERVEIEAELRLQTLEWLRRSAASGIDSTRVEPIVVVGPAAPAIADAAKERHAALVVIGRHQHPRGLPAMLGKTVRHVLDEVRCAVLVVPEPVTQQLPAG